MKVQTNRLLMFLTGAILVALVSLPAVGQNPAPKPFEPGEQLTYKAEISRSLLKKLDVATFKFSADQDSALKKETNGSTTTIVERSSLKFTGDVTSDGFFTRLFNINFHQHVVSIVDPESLAVRQTIKLDE